MKLPFPRTAKTLLYAAGATAIAVAAVVFALRQFSGDTPSPKEQEVTSSIQQHIPTPALETSPAEGQQNIPQTAPSNEADSPQYGPMNIEFPSSPFKEATVLYSAQEKNSSSQEEPPVLPPPSIAKLAAPQARTKATQTAPRSSRPIKQATQKAPIASAFPSSKGTSPAMRKEAPLQEYSAPKAAPDAPASRTYDAPVATSGPLKQPPTSPAESFVREKRQALTWQPVTPPTPALVPEEKAKSSEEAVEEQEIIASAATPATASEEELEKVLEKYKDIDFGDGEFIIDVYLRRQLIYAGMFAQTRGEVLYLPLTEFFDLLRFPINVSAEGASGWFLTKRHTFDFQTSTGTGTKDDKPFTLSSNEFFVIDNEIYVKMERLDQLFALGLSLDFSQLALNIDPKEKLAFELLEERIRNRRIIQAQNGLRYPLRDLDYAAITPPHLRASLRYGHTGGKDQKDTDSASISGIYRGDLFFFSSVLYGSANQDWQGDRTETSFGNASYTGERLFRDNPYISNITIGDITGADSPFGSGGSLQRGIRISNKGFKRDSTYDVKTFSGKALPGWEAELYRNNQLVGFQTVGDEGVYLFENVPLLFGQNKFTLSLFGPEGQEEKREETVTVSTGLHLGEIEYDASFTQKGIGVFDKTISRVTSATIEEEGTPTISGTVKIGLGSAVDVAVGATHETVGSKERTITSARLSSSYENIFGAVSAGYYSSGEIGTRASLRGRLDENHTWGLSGNYHIADEYIESTAKDSIAIGVNGGKKVSDDARISYGLKASRAESVASPSGELDTIRDSVSGNFNVISPGISLYNSLSHTFYEKSDSGNDSEISGSTKAYVPLVGGSLRADTSYLHSDDDPLHFETVSGTLNLNVDKNISTSLRGRKSFSGQRLASLTNTWSYSLGSYSPHISGTWNSDDTYSLYAGINVSLDIDPFSYTPTISGKGASSGAACLVFEDANYNNEFDDGDIPLEGVTIRALASGQRVTTDENGRALFSRLAPQQDTDIEVRQSSIIDPMLFAKGGTAITPRAGKIYDVSFPLHRCTVIEGYVYLLENDEAVGKANIPLQIIDEAGNEVQKTWSESGGYFIAEKIMPGNYSIRIDEEYLSAKKFAGTTENNIVISNEVEEISGKILFCGLPNHVDVLAEKFRTALQFGKEAQLITSFTNLDEETDITFSQPDRMSLADITGTTHEETPVAAAESLQEEAPLQHYSLRIDTFISEKSAKRAVSHYRVRYKDELKGYSIDYRKENNAYLVEISGEMNEAEIKRIANLFLFSPKLIKLVPGEPVAEKNVRAMP